MYCQYRVFLYMHVVRHNERERERAEYIVSIESFCTCMLYVITREREREARIYCQYRVFLYMHVVRHNEREREARIYCQYRVFLYMHAVCHKEREGERGPNIMSVSNVSVHACCTS